MSHLAGCMTHTIDRNAFPHESFREIDAGTTLNARARARAEIAVRLQSAFPAINDTLLCFSAAHAERSLGAGRLVV